MKAIIYFATAASMVLPPGNSEKIEAGVPSGIKKQSPEISEVVKPHLNPITEEVFVLKDSVVAFSHETIISNCECIEECECIDFILVEHRPEFPGGDQALLDYMAHTVKYPEMAVDGCITGTVYIQFTITKKGKVDDVKVIRSIHPLLDEPAVEVIKNLPDWIPGKQRGKPVNVSFVIPIKFTLDGCSDKLIPVIVKTKTDSLPADTLAIAPLNNELLPENQTTEIINETEAVTVNIKVYPNPASDFINIETTGFPEQSRYQVLSINGKIISEGVLDSELTMIGLDNVATGTYILVIYSADGSIRKTEKLAIRR